jgi:hypothetical protein
MPARAALAKEAEPDATRTHDGRNAAFGLRLVRPGRLRRELRRMLNRAEPIRLLADDTGGSQSSLRTQGLLSSLLMQLPAPGCDARPR